MSKYLCLNGNHTLTSEPVFKIDNRAFNYGDGFFETIRCLNSIPLFFDKHYERIQRTAKTLKMELPGALSKDYLHHQIERLLQKNRIYKGARARITFFRNSGGLYTPEDNSVGFVITVSGLDHEFYEVGSKGLKVGVYSELSKPINCLSAIKSTNAMLYIVAGTWRKNHQLDDCLLVNQEGKIIEGLSSNIFLVKNNMLLATTEDCGCVDGTMRKTILEIAKKKNIKVQLVHGFPEEILLSADEILLTNAIQGVKYIAAYHNRRYYNVMAKLFTDELNILIKETIQ